MPIVVVDPRRVENYQWHVSALSILLLQGDAEARLLGQAGATLQACFPDTEIRFKAEWTTRSDLLGRDAPSPPAALVHRNLLPARPVAELLEEPHDVVLFSVLADATLPILRGRDGGCFVPHGGLVDRWSIEDREWVETDCVDGGLLDALEGGRALEAVIEPLLNRGTVVAICNVFRHVKSAPEHRLRDVTDSLRERIRATNVEVARLSHRTGCFVLDLDRALAHEGGVALSADYSGGDGRAEELALEELLALALEAVPSLAEGAT